MIDINLGFTVDREPDNKRALALLTEVTKSHDPKQPLVTTLALEREINPFLRLTSQTVISKLREGFPAMPKNPSPKEVFLRLRQLRDHW